MSSLNSIGSTGGSVDISYLLSTGTQPKFTIIPVLSGRLFIYFMLEGMKSTAVRKGANTM
jgi:hypothetical protein